MFRTEGNEQEKARAECEEMLRQLEEHWPAGKKFFGGESIGMADIALGGVAHWLPVIEEVVGVKILNPLAFPNLLKWIYNFKEEPIIKQNLPDRNEMFLFLKKQREILFLSSLN